MKRIIFMVAQTLRSIMKAGPLLDIQIGHIINPEFPTMWCLKASGATWWHFSCFQKTWIGTQWWHVVFTIWCRSGWIIILRWLQFRISTVYYNITTSENSINACVMEGRSSVSHYKSLPNICKTKIQNIITRYRLLPNCWDSSKFRDKSTLMLGVAMNVQEALLPIVCWVTYHPKFLTSIISAEAYVSNITAIFYWYGLVGMTAQTPPSIRHPGWGSGRVSTQQP